VFRFVNNLSTECQCYYIVTPKYQITLYYSTTNFSFSLTSVSPEIQRDPNITEHLMHRRIVSVAWVLKVTWSQTENTSFSQSSVTNDYCSPLFDLETALSVALGMSILVHCHIGTETVQVTPMRRTLASSP